jgi:competence protein ComEC
LEVSNLDMVLVTHPDADHIGGAASVLRRFPNALLAMNAEFQASPEVRELLRLTGRKADEIWWLRGRHVMSVGSARIDVIAPPKTDDDNSGSLMMRFASPAGRLVLTGDAPEDSEVQHLGQMDWSCDVLLAGHHGSAGSTSEPWLRTTGPRWLAISCGRQNPYGHPSREVLRRAANAGAEVLRTDQGGTLEFMSVGGRYTPLLKKR